LGAFDCWICIHDKKRSWPVSEKKKRTKVEETRKHTIFAIEDEEATS
jgi:hypothetical protein